MQQATHMHHGRGYMASIVFFAGLLSLLLAGMLEWAFSKPFLACLWIAGFFFVSLNLSYLLHVCLVSWWLRPVRLPEIHLPQMPSTAILYIVRNEPEALFQSMRETFAGNHEPRVDLWLISNSTDEARILDEQNAVRRLRHAFGHDRVHLFAPAENPTGRKHLAAQEWLRKHTDYQYMIVCDADTVLPPGCVRKLAQKAEHPDNQAIAIFQSHPQVGRTRTRFATFLEPGQNLVHRAFCQANYAIFGTSPYYGHGALVRCACFRGLAVPDLALSHDIWETAAMDQAGWRIAFCHDVETHEMFPSDYLEFRRRSRRWILGTLETLPLLASRRLSPGVRFHLLWASYVYVVQPVFLGWVLLGLLAHTSLAGPMLRTQSVYLGGATAIDFEMGGLSVFTLGFIWGFKLRYCRTLRQVGQIIRDILMGTVVLLNNMFYDTVAILASPWMDRSWRPMQKLNCRRLSLGQCLAAMWPSTLFGVLLVVAGWSLNPGWLLYSSPILISFVLGGFSVYWTAKPVAGKPHCLGGACENM